MSKRGSVRVEVEKTSKKRDYQTRGEQETQKYIL